MVGVEGEGDMLGRAPLQLAVNNEHQELRMREGEGGG